MKKCDLNFVQHFNQSTEIMKNTMFGQSEFARTNVDYKPICVLLPTCSVIL